MTVRRYQSKAIRQPRGRLGAETLYDSFTRSNITGWLGVADSGQAWGQIVNPFSLSSNTAVPTGAGALNVATIDAQSADVYIKASMKVGSSSGGGIAIRAKATTSSSGSWVEYQLLSGGTSLRLMRVPDFANIVSPVTVSKTVGTTVTMEVWVIGNSYTCALDGTTLITTTEAQNQTVPVHGLYAEDTSVAFSSFLMRPI